MKKHARSDFFVVGCMFALWRGGLFILEKIAPNLWPLRKDFLGLVTPWANFDGAHYTSIARDGYGVYQLAFFPIYPLLIRLMRLASSFPYEYIGVFISLGAFFIGLFLFWRYLEGSMGRGWSLVLFLVYPASFFFAAAYSESIFFALAIGTLLSIKRERWLLAGIVAGFASATRLVGVFLWLPLVITMWQKRRYLKVIDWIAVFIAPAGLAGYMVYLWKFVGDPLAFFHVQSAFGAGRSGSEIIFLPQVLWRYARIFITVPTGDLLYHVAVLEFLTFVLGVILLVAAWRKRYAFGLLLYSACVLFLPSLTGTLSSMPRYLLALFPLFPVFGEIRSSWVKLVILIVFITLLVYATTGFLRGYFIS
ncbi:MAG: hypothetical protein AAB557_00415 [Patescibacteria group bacterium]